MKRCVTILILMLAPIACADSIQVIATDLRADSPVPFRYGVAADLATNIYDAQLTAPYAGPTSLELSIDSVIRAIGIDGTAYVGFANVDPITWLQSEIAIDPGATVSLLPSAIYFGDAPVQWTATPEPGAWLMLIAGLVVIITVVALSGRVWRYMKLMEQEPPAAPIILTPWGPVSEGARKQAALNMLEDSELRSRVFQIVLNECNGDAEKASFEFARRYPELDGLMVDYNETTN